MNARVRQLNKFDQLQSNASCNKFFNTTEHGPGDDHCHQGTSHPDCMSLLYNGQVLPPARMWRRPDFFCQQLHGSKCHSSTEKTNALQIAYGGRAQLSLQSAEEAQWSDLGLVAINEATVMASIVALFVVVTAKRIGKKLRVGMTKCWAETVVTCVATTFWSYLAESMVSPLLALVSQNPSHLF